jgi:N-acetylglucosaminyldiphosphoundecaprenol N-acetyl-beta-D-mannosaminyltransferase
MLVNLCQSNKADDSEVVNFLGIGIEAVTFQDMFLKVDRWLADKSKRSHHVAVVNAYCITSSLNNPRLRKIYNGADLVGPDGMPFVHWIKKVVRKPCDHFAGFDVVAKIAEKSKEKGYTFYLYGGHPEVLIRAKENLETMFPHINILGYRSPPFRPLTKEEDL